MQGWQEFYAVTAGAAATLMGLLFVAVSINAAVIFGAAHENSRRLAEQVFQNYLAVLLISLLAIFPSMNITEFSRTTLAVTAAWSIWVIIRAWRTLTRTREPGEKLRALRRHLAPLVGFAILIAAAARMAFGPGDSRSLFAAGLLVLLISATALSWDLLLRLAAAKSP